MYTKCLSQNRLNIGFIYFLFHYFTYITKNLGYSQNSSTVVFVQHNCKHLKINVRNLLCTFELIFLYIKFESGRCTVFPSGLKLLCITSNSTLNNYSTYASK